MKNIVFAIVLSVFLAGCSQTPIPTITPTRKPLILPKVKPLQLKLIEGKFSAGKTKETSTFVLSYKGYNDLLTNNKLITNRLKLLNQRVNIIQKYYSKP